MNRLIINTFNTLYQKISILIFLFFFFANFPLNAATLGINNGFESGALGLSKCSGNCPKVSTAQKKNGKYSADFTLTRKMKTGYRTEVTIPQKGNFDFGKEYWIGMDYLYKDWATDPEPEMAPFQVHSKPSAWTSKCRLHSAHNTAPFLMSSQSGKVSFLTYGRKKLWTGSIQKNQWLNIIVHFKISAGSDGFVEAWKDGVKLGRVNGPNSPKNDNCGKPMRSPFFKMGIYKSTWKYRATVATRRQLFIDNLKIAEGSNGYSLISSSLAPAPKPVAVKAPAPKPVAVKAPAPKPVAVKAPAPKPVAVKAPAPKPVAVKAPAPKPVAVKAPAPKPTKAPARNLKKDITPPVISNLQAIVTDTSATITWNTNEASRSLVKYGLSSRYNMNTNSTLLVTSHKTTLKNLVAGKVYHYQVNAEDSSGNRKTNQNLTFTVDSISNITEEGLVAHWPMDTGSGSGTTIADRSGNRYTGKLINGAHLIIGEGVKFDGVNDYFDAGKINVGGNAMTLSAWFWADDLSNCKARDCRIISKATGSAEQAHYFMLSTIKVGSKTRLRFRLKTNGRTSTLIANSGNIVKNEWVNVTASYDGKTMRLYKDGVEVGSKAKQGLITTNSKSTVWIGGNPSNATSRPWKGHIGDVRIYNYAMTGAEISELANSENTLEMDKIAPKISNVQVAVTDKTAAISWNTNESSDSVTKYGLTNRYGSNIDNGLLVTNHKVTLKNLEAGKQYHYKINSKDSNKNIGGTKDLVFTTESTTEEGLVAHWLMETKTGSTIADRSGNGYAGKLMNGAHLITGEGIKFDGVNDYLNVGNLNVTGQAISLSAWFWADDLSNCRARDCRLISKATGAAEKNHYFMVSTIKVGSKTRLRFRLKTNGKTSTLIAASGDIFKNQWVHVAAIYDGQTMHLYKDGVEVGSRAKRGSITTNSKTPVWIGGNPSGATSRPWKGHIGDVRIYSYPLTNNEIRILAK